MSGIDDQIRNNEGDINYGLSKEKPQSGLFSY